MTDCFVDTSGWAEWVDQALLYHAQARNAIREVVKRGGRLVTSSVVLAELTALLVSPLRIPKGKQIQFLDDLRSDPSVDIVPFDRQLEGEAWDLWRSRPDKAWSLVDCASFVVMRQRKLLEAITSDHHFEQAGFVRLLQ